MKKLYKTIATIVLCSLFTFRLAAQMNGIYTINQTIAASPTNFVSFTALSASLTANGVSGPVTINVVSATGPYIEQVNFLQATGVSSGNTITVNGNGNTITFAGTTGSPHTLMLSGADYMFFNNLTVVGTGAAGLAIHLWNGADNNQFLNCTATLPANSTTTNMYPISLSGSQTSATGLGNSGNNNIFDGCTTNSGRYGFIFYGNTGSPYNTGNQILNCNILDFYQMGIRHYYCQNTIIRGNLIERPNRTTVTTTYGIYLDYVPSGGAGPLVDRNKIRRIFQGNQAYTGTFYGIMNNNYGASAGYEQVIRNNVISNITFNGYAYCYYNNFVSYDVFIHNTIVLDDMASTGGDVYGILSYAQSNSVVKNNLVSINRSGTGYKYCFYFGTSGMVSNNNILFNNSPNGVNNIGYYNADFATLSAWQGANGGAFDQASVSQNPSFNNPVLFDYTPTVAAMNNIGLPMGVAFDVNGLARNLPAPDAGAFEFFNTQCTGSPGANSVLTPTFIVCPSAVSALLLANTYTVNGINFQWQMSTGSALGPYLPVSGATLATLSQTLGTSAYFNVSMYCSNGGQTVTAAAGQVTVAGVTINTPPYFEGFENILGPEKLPNCSWSLSNAGRAHTANAPTFWMTARTGSSFAYHGTNNNGFGNAQYHYTNGLQLTAGVTYSASVWYVTPGYSTVSDFQLSYGTSQTPTGLTSIAIVTSPNNNQYAALTNTFTVPTSGLYYVAVKSTDNYNYDFFAWDDLAITIPCQIAPNAANLTVTGPTLVCAGQQASMFASGVGVNTYSWVSGPTTQIYTPVINQTGPYTTIGTNTLSGCTSTVTRIITANPLPPISVVASANSICEGQSLSLVAVGANSFTWNTGSLAPLTVVSPMASTSFTVAGTNAFGCVGLAVAPVVVNPLPVITVNGNTVACAGERITLTGGGAVTYTWNSISSFNVGSLVSLAPYASTSYFVSGTDANGCVGSTTRVISVEACTGINSQNGKANSLVVYPNPNNGVFTIEITNGLGKTFVVTDVTGRIILTGTSTSDKTDVNISQLANGIYYVKIKSDNVVEVIKVVKQ